MYKAKPIKVEENTQLFAIVEKLANRASIFQTQLYYIPSQMINAFATGIRDNALVRETDRIFRLEQMAQELQDQKSELLKNEFWQSDFLPYIGITKNVATPRSHVNGLWYLR